MRADLEQYVERRYLDPGTGAPVTVFKSGAMPVRPRRPFGPGQFQHGREIPKPALSGIEQEDDRYGDLDCACE